jgi:hypothetical protein
MKRAGVDWRVEPFVEAFVVYRYGSRPEPAGNLCCQHFSCPYPLAALSTVRSPCLPQEARLYALLT